MTKKNRSAFAKGFTLVEFLVVLAFIVMAALLVVSIVLLAGFIGYRAYRDHEHSQQQHSSIAPVPALTHTIAAEYSLRPAVIFDPVGLAATRDALC